MFLDTLYYFVPFFGIFLDFFLVFFWIFFLGLFLLRGTQGLRKPLYPRLLKSPSSFFLRQRKNPPCMCGSARIHPVWVATQNADRDCRNKQGHDIKRRHHPRSRQRKNPPFFRGHICRSSRDKITGASGRPTSSFFLGRGGKVAVNGVRSAFVT